MGIVLAAGGSSRLGYSKQLVEYEGQPLARRAVDAAIKAGLTPVIVVLGSEAGRVQAALEDLSDVVVVFNAAWQTGLASSLRAGLAEASKSSAGGAVVMAADQPHVSTEDLRRLAAAFEEGHRLVASSYSGVLGVPAVFGREFFGDISSLSGDAGAGGWLRSRKEVVKSISMDSAAFDVDVERDVVKLMQDRPME